MTASTRPSSVSRTSSLLSMVSGRGAAHAGQVGVDAPVPGPVGEQRLQGAHDLSVVDARAVERQERGAAAVFDVVHRDAVDGRKHGLNLLGGAFAPVRGGTGA
jgi:hypothetical protein